MHSGENKKTPTTTLGIPCSKCSSKNTSKKNHYTAGASTIWFLLLGWLYLIIRTALIKTNYTCNECDFEGKYRSNTSWVAIGIIAAITAIIILIALLETTTQPVH